MTEVLWQKLNPNNNEVKISKEESLQFKDNWKASSVGEKQRIFVNEELKQFKNGSMPHVYNGFLQLLALIDEEKMSFLDIGCASGYYKEVAEHQFPGKLDYIGCDYNEKSIELAKKYYPTTQFDIEDITKLTYSDKQFDVVMVSGVFEHVPDNELAFDETCRVAKKWLICHRIAFASGDEYITKGSQYSEPIIRHYFNRDRFIERITSRGFILDSYINIYPDNNNIQSFLFKRV